MADPWLKKNPLVSLWLNAATRLRGQDDPVCGGDTAHLEDDDPQTLPFVMSAPEPASVAPRPGSPPRGRVLDPRSFPHHPATTQRQATRS